jgi:hypothetical protein
LKQLGLPTINKEPLSKIILEGNRADLYGDIIATLPTTFDFDRNQGRPPTVFVPGIDPLRESVTLLDDRGSTVRGSDFICKSRVCIAPQSACGDQDSLVVPEFHSMDAYGQFMVNQVHVPCSKRSNEVILQVSLVLYDQVLMSTSTIQCLPCTRGQSRVEDSRQGVWYCVACADNQYILDPNNPAYSCQDCPVGAICDGNSLTGKVKGSVWRPDDSTGLYILEACPFGYERFGGGGSSNSQNQLSQRCSSCSVTQYIINSTYNCQQCPVGAICDGVTLRPRVSGSVWLPDYTLGQYLLTTCPPGYQIELAGRANLALQQCSLCPAGSYCIGGAASSTQCPLDTFSHAGSSASTACVPAIFVQLVAVLPCTKAFFETKQATFAICIASMVQLSTDEVIVDQVIPVVYRRIGASSLAIQVQSRIALRNQSAAEQVLLSITEANLNFELLSRGLPAASIVSVAILTISDSSDRRQLILTFTLIIGFLLAMGIALGYYIVRSRRKSEDQRELDAAVTTLRAQLKIRKVDGFVLHTERVLFLVDTKDLVFINKSYLEAAASIALSLEFNLLHFDALCNCLECHTSQFGLEIGIADGSKNPQYNALCDWMLEVCKALIDPGLEVQPGNLKRTPARERFAYFEKVCRAQIWKSHHGELFERLKGVARGFMDQIAKMCDERFEQIVKEPEGSKLAVLPSWPVAGEEQKALEGCAQYPDFFDSTTPATLRRNMDRMCVHPSIVL